VLTWLPQEARLFLPHLVKWLPLKLPYLESYIRLPKCEILGLCSPRRISSPSQPKGHVQYARPERSVVAGPKSAQIMHPGNVDGTWLGWCASFESGSQYRSWPTASTFFHSRTLCRGHYRMHGTIPNFSTSPNLSKLYLNGNSFSGQFPKDFFFSRHTWWSQKQHNSLLRLLENIGIEMMGG
jgi:hypothetical protein